MELIPQLRATKFNESLLIHNNMDMLGFQEWIFYPGMLFGSLDKWWDNRGCRSNPHEGLDICLYRTENSKVCHFDENFVIPVIFEGEIIKISDDFLGKSIFVGHNIHSQGNQLLTAYGHTGPKEDIHPGKVLKEGDILGTTAKMGKRSDGLLPHVHISIAWMPESLSYKMLNWKTMKDTNLVTLLDPLEIITSPYSVIHSSENV